jgi:hypothetical protein
MLFWTQESEKVFEPVAEQLKYVLKLASHGSWYSIPFLHRFYFFIPSVLFDFPTPKTNTQEHVVNADL